MTDRPDSFFLGRDTADPILDDREDHAAPAWGLALLGGLAVWLAGLAAAVWLVLG
jgi:hypothetical protein